MYWQLANTWANTLLLEYDTLQPLSFFKLTMISQMSNMLIVSL